MVGLSLFSVLRFLSDGTYVQIAINGKSYCPSTLRAFDLISDNLVKVAITDGISIFFTILGVLGISAGVGASAYFAVLYTPYYQQRISNPFVLTFISVLISFVVATIYLSMIDVAALSVLQCFLEDKDKGRGQGRYGS